jgi:hypothetical protein
MIHERANGNKNTGFFAISEPIDKLPQKEDFYYNVE